MAPFGMIGRAAVSGQSLLIFGTSDFLKRAERSGSCPSENEIHTRPIRSRKSIAEAIVSSSSFPRQTEAFNVIRETWDWTANSCGVAASTWKPSAEASFPRSSMKRALSSAVGSGTSYAATVLAHFGCSATRQAGQIRKRPMVKRNMGGGSNMARRGSMSAAPFGNLPSGGASSR